LEDTGEDAEVKFAYVVFRSMEGKARFCKAYKYDMSIPLGLKTYQWNFPSWCCCRRRSKIPES
jgi:hypothetical protein